MYLISVTRSSVFNEFTPAERRKWFSLTGKKVISHIDTFYYVVKIAGDHNENPEVQRLLDDLKESKAQKIAAIGEDVFFMDLAMMSNGFSIYEYRLSMNETFDIFFASTLPNEETPRICVQLRTRSLILNGTKGATEESFGYVKDILDAYGLTVGEVGENRIDYAYHTNLIQNGRAYFSDRSLLLHLRSKLRKYSKIGDISPSLTIDTLNLGMRKSNNVFFRAYNKTREVIEKNYKSFFFERWRQNGLISEYDLYVYRKAFDLASYRMGILVGRIKWYLEFGRKEETQERLSELLKACYVNSDNAGQIEKELNGLLPPVTQITNVEFQTKRKFYHSFDPFLREAFAKGESADELARLWQILRLSKSFTAYLTACSVCFVKDRKDPESEICDWWQRIRSCPVEESREDVEMMRSFDRHADILRSARRFSSAVAQLSVLRNGIEEDKTFEEDISDALAYLNDNDFYGFLPDPETGEVKDLRAPDYEEIRMRKKRQYRGILKPDEPQTEQNSNNYLQNQENEGEPNT